MSSFFNATSQLLNGWNYSCYVMMKKNSSEGDLDHVFCSAIGIRPKNTTMILLNINSEKYYF
nr:AlNc14C7G967 [Albugo laibachii Nc14]|eukprot:CCA14928.1 AlNc14C7G967 [Albugo laibachii Nc14]